MKKKKAATRLKLIRESLGISREDLAEKLGVSPQVVANMELGRKYIYADDLVQLSKIFGMSVDKFLGNEIKLSRELNRSENELINIYRSVSDPGKDLIMNVCKSIQDYEQVDTVPEKKFLIAASGAENASDEEIQEAIELAKNL